MSVKLIRSPDVARLACMAGFDAIYIDLEHGNFDLALTSQVCLTAYDLGMTALVRTRMDAIPSVLDAGAMGIIVPHVENADAARACVSLARFPPEGARGSVNRIPQLCFEHVPAKTLHPAVNAATFVAVMVESAAALAHMEDIASVAGVDMLFIGANDLSADLGIAGDYEHPGMQQAMRDIFHAAARHDKYIGLGGLGSRQDLLAQYIAKGARFVSMGADLTLFANAAGACVEKFKALALCRNGKSG
jgi:2-keto-3-deoxy-L-rhamnonate aldolase RhmA